MSKMRIEIPGWGNIDIENIVIDLNGTIETPGVVLLVERLQIGILRRIAAERGDVDDQQDLALIAAELHGLAVDVLHRVVEHRCDGILVLC